MDYMHKFLQTSDQHCYLIPVHSIEGVYRGPKIITVIIMSHFHTEEWYYDQNVQ